MRIGELSRRTGVRTHQLRYYEEQGLLEPTRAGNGYREYDEAAVTTVVQIRKLLAGGLTTEEIKVLMPCVTGTEPEFEPCPELIDLLHERRRVLDEQLDALQATRSVLSSYINRLVRTELPSGATGF